MRWRGRRGKATDREMSTHCEAKSVLTSCFHSGQGQLSHPLKSFSTVIDQVNTEGWPNPNTKQPLLSPFPSVSRHNTKTMNISTQQCSVTSSSQFCAMPVICSGRLLAVLICSGGGLALSCLCES